MNLLTNVLLPDYNIGSGRSNSISILETFKLIWYISGGESIYKDVDKNRNGDHICYISDLGKMMEHYPDRFIRKDIKTPSQEIYNSQNQMLN